MTMLYPILLETEENGAVSAYVPGCRCMLPPIHTRRPSAPFARCCPST
jgi:hypothetical protein